MFEKLGGVALRSADLSNQVPRESESYSARYSVLAQRWQYRFAKRLIDIIAAVFALFMLLPFMLTIALLIKLTSSGPIFYRWHVIGYLGNRFLAYKFRTMVENAEEMEEQLRIAGKNEMDGVYFKLKNDARITSIGAFLRKFSMDELPTLYSVIAGQMSLVGPRPVRARELVHLSDWHKVRFLAKPGITGLWQISGKNEINDFDEIVQIDLEYMDRWSLLLDVWILLRTIPFVISGRNY